MIIKLQSVISNWSTTVHCRQKSLLQSKKIKKMNQIAAINSIKYIWSHPNNQHKKTQSILKYFGYKLYKILKLKPIDIEILQGVKIRCFPKSYTSDCVIHCGLYDYNEMHFMIRYLREEDSFLDIGANIGIYSIIAASKINSGSIYSFEALPENYARLQENIKLNRFQQVHAYPIAISDNKGTVALNIGEGDSLPFISNSHTTNTISVATETLDNLLDNQDISQLTLAKIDIEGAELLALKGAANLLEKQRPIVWIMEINYTVNHFNYSQQDVVDFLESYDYFLYEYNASSNSINPVKLNEKKGLNVLVIAKKYLDFVCERLQQN